MHPSRHSFAYQAESVRRQFAQGSELPFADVLDARLLAQALRQHPVHGRNRVFTPLVTLRLMLSQALDADPSCQKALDRFLAERAATGQRAISAHNGGYCQARRRLPEGLLPHLVRRVGRELLWQAPPRWLWKGRDVKVVDGTTVSLPDTPANQQAYPQPPCQRAGVGFPLLRLVVLFSLAVGTVLEAALGPYRGKQTGETALFRTLHDQLDEGDVVLGDRYFGSYLEIALLQQRGVDAVFRLHQRRLADFRRGERLGRDDHVVVWHKPERPDWLDAATYDRLPATLTVREVRIRVTPPGFRSQKIVVVTTLLDAERYSRHDLAELYRRRWQVELDLRALKVDLRLDVLRARSPGMVRKELWAHLLAYNLIRTVMAQAAQAHERQPRQLSFKGALQTIDSFAPQLLTASPAKRVALTEQVLAAVAQHRVGHRADRVEPRKRKRRPKPYGLLNEPRAQARKHLLQTGSG